MGPHYADPLGHYHDPIEQQTTGMDPQEGPQKGTQPMKASP